MEGGMGSVEYGPYRNEAEHVRFAQIARDSFTFPEPLVEPYFHAVGRENMRVVRRDDEVVGGLAILPMGQFFGGRSIPMGGIAVVAVAPEQRARGAATQLLREMLAELYGAGTPLSSLYPATLALYRRVGYESAGYACEATLPFKDIDLRDRGLAVRRAEERDEPEIRALYQRWAAGVPGMLDRNEFIWGRVHLLRGEATQGYVIRGTDGLEGYAFLLTQFIDFYHANVRVVDVVTITPAAARVLLTFLADFRTTRDNVLVRVGPADPLLGMLREEHYTIERRVPWMLRIVNVEEALRQRGYPRELSGELQLHVEDEDLPQNSGPWVLRVREGAATVERGGRGRLRLHTRGLAALFSGYQRAENLRIQGLADGPADELAGATALFAGPVPWMRDGF
jgi:predicted acetyltransferase